MTPAVRATRDAVTDIMRGVLAKVSQFSRSGEGGESAERKAPNGHSSSSSSSGHSHSSSHGHSSSRAVDAGPSPSSSHRGSYDELVAQLKQEKMLLERRVRALEEEKESLSGNRAGVHPLSADPGGCRSNLLIVVYRCLHSSILVCILFL